MHHAGVRLDEGTKLLNYEVRVASHISELQFWDPRAVSTADRNTHLWPTAIGRRDYGTVRLVGFAVVVIPEDRRGKEFRPHGRRVRPFEEGIDVRR